MKKPKMAIVKGTSADLEFLQLKAKLHKLLEWIKTNFNSPKHIHEEPCGLCNIASEILDVLEGTKLGEKASALVKSFSHIKRAVEAREKAKALKCEPCDNDNYDQKCSCEVIQDAREETEETLENTVTQFFNIYEEVL